MELLVELLRREMGLLTLVVHFVLDDCGICIWIEINLIKGQTVI